MQCDTHNTHTVPSATDRLAVLLTACQRHNTVLQFAENIENPYSNAAAQDVSGPPWEPGTAGSIG